MSESERDQSHADKASVSPKPLNCDPDARRWAREFMEVWNKNPVMDEGWMLSWFANAIMCGDDTRRWKMEKELEQERDIRSTREITLSLVADGLGVEHEPHQTFDERLLEASCTPRSAGTSLSDRCSKCGDEVGMRLICTKLGCPLHSQVAQSASERIEKRAQIGNTIFSPGIAVQTVIERAYREYEYQHTPEKETERLERVGEFRKALGVCPKCGANRFAEPCPNGHVAAAMGQCPMVGTAEGPK